MIFASLINDFVNVLIFFGAVVIGGIYVVVAAIVLLARHIRKDYQKQGGAPALAKKVAVGTAAGLVKRAIRGRFR